MLVWNTNRKLHIYIVQWHHYIWLWVTLNGQFHSHSDFKVLYLIKDVSQATIPYDYTCYGHVWWCLVKSNTYRFLHSMLQKFHWAKLNDYENKRTVGLGALLNNQLGHGPKFQKLHIHHLPIPGRRNWASFCSIGSGFRDNGWFSKLPYLGMKLACLACFGHLKLACFGIGQNPEVVHILSFPKGLKIKLILTLRAAVSEILADVQNCHISAWIPEVAYIPSFFS